MTACLLAAYRRQDKTIKCEFKPKSVCTFPFCQKTAKDDFQPINATQNVQYDATQAFQTFTISE